MSTPSEVWLGLDVGTRRIGIALSNALRIAQPLLTLERTQPRRDLRSILRLARRYNCVGIIIGNPLHLSGDASRQTERVHRFVAELEALIAERTADRIEDGVEQPRPSTSLSDFAPDHSATSSPLRVHLWDERLSTAEVHTALDATGHDPRRYASRDRGHISGRRHVIDQLAAALILQGWLDAQSGVVTLLPPDP